MINISKENSSFLKIQGDYPDKKLISEYFQKPAQNYFFHPLYKTGRWDGKIRFFNLNTGQFPYGLIKDLIYYLERAKIKFDISDSLYKEITTPENLNGFDLLIKELNLEQREYQINAAKKILETKRGILEHPTGSGKTATISLILYYLLNQGYKYIIYIVPNKSLLFQTETIFKQYGINKDIIGKYYGDEKDSSKIITIGTWQSLRKNDILLNKAEIIIGDECQHAKAKEINELMRKCINSVYRIGVTGSLPKWEADKTTIIGNFGPIIDKIDTNHLIYKEKVLSPVKVKIFNLHYPKNIKKLITEYREEKIVLKEYPQRKKLVKMLLEQYCNNDNTLILFDEIDLGKQYYDYVSPFFTNKKFYWIEGAVKPEEREKIRLLTNKEDNVIIFGTLGTMSTGIDIKKLHNIIFLFVGKSYIRLKQSIGRGMRLHETKENVTIFDIADNLKYGKRHLNERIKIYGEEGFPFELFEIGGEK